MKERKARVEDALHATRAAVEEGIVAGGGVALIRAADALSKLSLSGEEAVGRDIVRKALSAPARYIADNAGEEGSVVVEKIKSLKKNHGFDAQKGEYVDMVEAGIIDPTMVTRTALQNAASVAGLLITTECMVSEIPEDKPPMAGPPHGGGGMY